MTIFKKRKVAWTILLLAIIFALLFGNYRHKPNEVQILPSGQYVQDNANVLSDETEQYITKMNNGLVSDVGGEIHVITLNTTGDRDIADVSIERGINLNLSGNSCVFLIAVDDIDRYIVPGEDIMYALNDRVLSNLLQETFTVQDFENKKLDAPTKEAFADLIELYENYYDTSILPAGNVTVQTQTDSDSDNMQAFAIIILLLLILIVINVSFRTRRTVIFGTPRTTRGYYPPRGSYRTPPPFNSRSSTSNSSRSGGFGSSSRGGSFSSSSRSGGFGSSSRGGGFRSGGSRSSSSRGGGFRSR